MPLFDYGCSRGHVLKDQIVKLDARDAKQICVKCDGPLRRLLGAPSAFPKAASWRKKDRA